MSTPSSSVGPAAGFLLFILGIWLLIRTVAGGLVKKILNLGSSKS
jgi:hypothetical protein